MEQLQTELIPPLQAVTYQQEVKEDEKEKGWGEEKMMGGEERELY